MVAKFRRANICPSLQYGSVRQNGRRNRRDARSRTDLNQWWNYPHLSSVLKTYNHASAWKEQQVQPGLDSPLGTSNE